MRILLLHAAGAALGIMSQLTDPDFPLHGFLWDHLLDPGAVLEQRAAVLRLLQIGLAPQVGPSPQRATSGSDTNAAATDVAAPEMHCQPDAHIQSQIRSHSSETENAASASQQAEPESAQQLQQKLLIGLLEALPMVLQDAVSGSPAVTPGSSNPSSSNHSNRSSSSEDLPELAAESAETNIYQEDKEDVSSHDLKQEKDQKETQNPEAEAVDGSATRTLLALMLHAAGQCSSHGMLAVLELPAALASALPRLLMTPKVSAQFGSVRLQTPSLCDQHDLRVACMLVMESGSMSACRIAGSMSPAILKVKELPLARPSKVTTRKITVVREQ